MGTTKGSLEGEVGVGQEVETAMEYLAVVVEDAHSQLSAIEARLSNCLSRVAPYNLAEAIESQAIACNTALQAASKIVAGLLTLVTLQGRLVGHKG